MATINPNYPLNSPSGNVYIDSLIWGGSWSANNGTTTNITWSATTGNIYSDSSAIGATWLSYETVALQNAFQTWSNVANITFTQLTSGSNVNIEYYIVSPSGMQDLTGDSTTLGFHETPDGSVAAPLYGVFNYGGAGWTSLGLRQGGYGFLTLIHEIGHGLGLAHPHDNGGGSSIFPGVTSAFGSYGTYELNQGIWTIESYNDGWNQVPSPLVDISYGQTGTPMAFDIAAIQHIYGANMNYQTGNNTYVLPNQNGGGTFWSSIWDAGGKDTITAQGSNVSAYINLNAAPLVGPNAGGYVSHVNGIVGGFTIANKVVIENAIGGNANDVLIGNSAGNSLNGGAGNDTLDGGAGIDTLIGGTGNDTYVVDHVGDTITELTGEGTDLVQSSISFDLSVKAQYVENLTLTGTSAINGTGNALNNEIRGNAAANILDGGAGADTLIGGGGNDTYVVDNTGDTVIEALNAGTDLVKVAINTANGSYTLTDNVENATLTNTVAYSLVGNSLNNVLTGNAAANTLDGGAGIDTLIGGAGNDTYLIDLNTNGTMQDKVVEAALSGDLNDTIQLRGNSTNTVFTTLTLAANIEHLDASATGTSKLNLTGNTAANILTGNAAANILNGGAGNDTLNGGAGNDTLIGGAGNDILIGGAGNDILTGGGGADVFKFEFTPLNTLNNIDVITDFSSLQLDTIWLSSSIFSTLANGVLGASNFVSGVGAVALDATDHIIYNSSTGALYYDADGNGAAAAIQFATLAGSPTLQASDIYVGV